MPGGCLATDQARALRVAGGSWLFTVNNVRYKASDQEPRFYVELQARRPEFGTGLWRSLEPLQQLMTVTPGSSPAPAKGCVFSTAARLDMRAWHPCVQAQTPCGCSGWRRSTESGRRLRITSSGSPAQPRDRLAR